jgi:GT2 family glycosyltransferase
LYTDEVAVPEGEPAAVEVLKPGWSPRLILEGNYVGGLCVVRTDAARAAGGFQPDDDSTGGYDLLLRMVDAGARVGHAPVVARSSAACWPPTAASPEARAAAQRATERSLERRGLRGSVEAGEVWQRVRLAADELPVSVVIPTRDKVELLRRCVETVEATRYPSLEIIIIDNGSLKQPTLDYLANTPHRVVRHPGIFNFSDLVNAGAAASTNPLLVLLNNDTETSDPTWLSTMVAELADERVGAVGCKLSFDDGTPQHEGIALGLGSISAVNLDLGQYCHFDRAVRDVVAVTAACVLVRRSAWEAVGGFDHALAVGFGDVDFCLRLRAAGYHVVYTPHAELVHAAQATRGNKTHRFDDQLFNALWPLHRSRETDPFVNRRIESFAPLWVTPADGGVRGSA